MKTRFTVFLVEDDDAIRGALKHIMEHEGYLVFTGENALEAIEKIQILAPSIDLILTDMQMPADGSRLIDYLEKNRALSHIPIIPMSAGGLSEISGKKVLVKPLDIPKLMKLIHETISKDRQNRNLDNSREVDGGPTVEPKP